MYRPGEVLSTTIIAFTISQMIFKLGQYEKSNERKAITTAVDKIGPKAEDADTGKDLPTGTEAIVEKESTKDDTNNSVG